MKVTYKKFMNETILSEVPHVEYTDKISYKDMKSKLVDFRIEKMKISKEEKDEIMRSFMNGNPIAGYLTSKKKWLVFTLDDVKLTTSVPNNMVKLPDDWSKYILVVDDE